MRKIITTTCFIFCLSLLPLSPVHAHANTETIVGHATLAAGAHPAVHGMIGNVWFDRIENRTMYNIEDSNYQLLTAAGVDKDAEIHSTQKAAKSDGLSPSAIMVCRRTAR